MPHAATGEELARAKERSDLDIALKDRADDAAYLDTVEKGLRRAVAKVTGVGTSARMR